MAPSDIRQRFEDIASRLGSARDKVQAAREGGGSPALSEDYWAAVRDLFTRGVTRQNLLEVVAYEPRETVRYFTREIDFAELRGQPWPVRYAKAAWKVFLAVAHRLSPARRVLFAIAAPLLAITVVYAVLSHAGRNPLSLPSILLEPAVPAVLLFFLLVLELRDKLVLKGDLEVARQIQFGLLPFEPVDADGYSIRTAMRPANTVGGDYFDLIDLGEGRVGVTIGDVAGKGMPAALLMALLQGSLRTLISAGFRGSELLAKLNAHMHASIPSNRLVTLFYAELDKRAGRLVCLNAGHNPPFVLGSGGSIRRLEATGVALGILRNATFEESVVDLAPGDRLFLYTDGITEAEDAVDNQYGDERLEAFLAARRSLELRALIDELIVDVLAFCGSAKPRDDMTLLCLERSRWSSR